MRMAPLVTSDTQDGMDSPPLLGAWSSRLEILLLSMERLLQKFSQRYDSSRNDLAHLLKSAVARVLAFPWCDCTFSSPEEMILLLLKGATAPVLDFRWCSYTLHLSTDRKNHISDHFSRFLPWCDCRSCFSMVRLLSHA